MDRPTLSLQTVSFGEIDESEARRLGVDLYELLTRPVSDPLGFGAGIPVLSAVAADRVDLEAAHVVVLVPVLGKTTFHSQRDSVLARLNEWHETLGAGHVLVVPAAPVWRNVEDRLPGKQLLTELYGSGDRRRKTLDEIVLAVSRLLEEGSKKAQLFVSHSKTDLTETDNAAKQIHDHVVTDTTGRAFFDAMALRPGESLPGQLDEAVSRGVFVAVRGDAYSSRVWCQRELLTAKLHGLPTLTVEVLKKGEQRSSPYGGNSPSLVWSGDPAAVASRAMVEWLRDVHFRKEAQRLAAVAGLPNDVTVLGRPPELLDLAQGTLQSQNAQLVIHPDPELSVVERQVLKAAQPRIQLVTPTTAFRRLLTRGKGTTTVDAPLGGWQVAMSLSDSPDVNGPEGYTAQHVEDATVHLARSLISAGASIAYGGDFRLNGFTPLLAELIQAYNQTASSSAGFLHSYLGASIKLDEIPDNLAVTVHHLVDSPDVRPDAVMPPLSTKETHPGALYFSDMRRVMAKHTAAWIVLGGGAIPKSKVRPGGYGGRYPGVVEEAWRTLEAGQPLYVVGGFGGAAALVADLLEGRETPERLQDKTWWGDETFRANAEAIDADEFRVKLGLPQRMEDLAQAVRDLGLTRLAPDAAVAFNGLTIDENRFLFRTRDPVAIAALVLKGLLKKSRDRAAGKLEIELVHGSVTSASNLDAIAIATFDKVPLGGAGAALDRAIGGRATVERAEGRNLVSLNAADVDADWLYLASLGPLENVDKLEQPIERAARETAEQSHRHGFRRLGVVAFGGAVVSDAKLVVEAMLRGFQGLAGKTTVVWFESDQQRFDLFHEQLAQRQTQDTLSLTTLRIATKLSVPPARVEELILAVSLDQQQLTVTALPPAGSAVASSLTTLLSDARLNEIAAGGGFEKRNTPDLKTLAKRGAQLGELLFGKHAEEMLSRCREAKIVIVHDVASSKLPFELLTSQGTSLPPSVQSGLSRRLAARDVPIEHLFARPPRAGKLKVLMIVNPTGDLAGAEQEAAVVRAILEQQKDRVDSPRVLSGPQATKQAVLAALPGADILHYCGHAYFDGHGPGESGLELHDGKLTIDEMKGIGELPRIAFMNACEAARVRGATASKAAAFAELFLRSGVEAYLGTFWRVGDLAASTFAREVYSSLAEGQTLESAVKQGRAALHTANQPDWANYILYGDGRFQLVVG